MDPGFDKCESCGKGWPECNCALKQLEKRTPPLTIEEIAKKAGINLAKPSDTKIRESQKKSVAIQADEAVNGERQRYYGHPKKNLQMIADLWNAYLAEKLNSSQKITAADAGMMMVLVKVAREGNCHKEDNLVDICGYALTVEKVYE